jgi:hypothetical protein
VIFTSKGIVRRGLKSPPERTRQQWVYARFSSLPLKCGIVRSVRKTSSVCMGIVLNVEDLNQRTKGVRNMWLYLRSKLSKENDGTHQYYAGKTHHDNYHNREDSRGAGKFAVGMDGKELAVQIDEEYTHIDETSGIQFLIAFFGGRSHVGNKQQVSQPVTGWEWDN